MAVREIVIPVSPETAEAYERAPARERELIISFVEGRLRPRSRSEILADLDETRRKLGAEAKANGLTPELLEEILAEDP